MLTPPAYLPASVASRDLSSLQLGCRTLLPLSQATPCTCPGATMVWVAHSPPHCVASVLIRGFRSLAPQRPNCLSPGMLFLLTACPKWQSPCPPPHHSTFLLEMSFFVLSSSHICSACCSPLQSYVLSLLSCSYPVLAALD